MQNPSIKYIPLLWLALLAAGTVILRSETRHSVDNKGWLAERLLEKRVDLGIKYLDMNMPSPEAFHRLLAADVHADVDPWGQTIDYYQHLVDAMPLLPEGYALLGFCRYTRGDKAGAFEMFQKAYFIQPSFFYNALNLSLMYFEAGRGTDAEKILALALNTDPRNSLQLIASSKAYNDILNANKDYDIVKTLRLNLASTDIFLQRYRQDPSTTPASCGLRVRIF